MDSCFFISIVIRRALGLQDEEGIRLQDQEGMKVIG